MSEYGEKDFKEFYDSEDNTYRNGDGMVVDEEAKQYISSGGKRYRKKGTKRRYGGFAPLPLYGGQALSSPIPKVGGRSMKYGGQALSSPIPTGGKSRKGRKSKKSRKSRNSKKSRKSRKTRKH